MNNLSSEELGTEADWFRNRVKGQTYKIIELDGEGTSKDLFLNGISGFRLYFIQKVGENIETLEELGENQDVYVLEAKSACRIVKELEDSNPRLAEELRTGFLDGVPELEINMKLNQEIFRNFLEETCLYLTTCWNLGEMILERVKKN